MLERIGTIGSTHGVKASAMPSRKNTGRVQANDRCASMRLMSESLPATAAMAGIEATSAPGVGGVAGVAVLKPVSRTVFSSGG